MKFSFRYTISFIIFVVLMALVARQVLVAKENAPHLSWWQAMIDSINPFWQTPNIYDANKSPIIIPVSINNPNDVAILATGKVELVHNGQVLEKIGIIWKSETSSGMLVDYLPVNPENISIEPGQQKDFAIEWKWFGNHYLDMNSNMPVIQFQSLHDTFQHQEDLSFYEKVTAKYYNYPLTAKVNLITLNTASNEQTFLDETTYDVPAGYFLFEKQLNSGLIFNFGLIIIFALILWKSVSTIPEEHAENVYIKKMPISEDNLLELEQKAQEEMQKISQKKSHKIAKKWKKSKKNIWL